MELRKYLLIPLLVLALLLGACADTGEEVDDGVVGEEPLGTEVLGEEPLGTDVAGEEPLATEPVMTEPAATDVLATEPMATQVVSTPEPTVEAVTTPGAQATTVGGEAEVEAGLVAVPFDQFMVATLAEGDVLGETDAEAAATPAVQATDAGAAGTPAAQTTPAAEATTGTMAGEAEGVRTMVRASDLVGSEIVDMQGNTVGTVEEVLVDQMGVVQYVVFDATAFLETDGEAGETGAVNTPAAQATGAAGEMGAMTLADEDTMLVYTGTAADLVTAAGFDQSLLDQEGIVVDTTATDADAAAAAELNGLIRASRFTDFDLQNAQEEDLGEVEDLLINLRTGEVPFAVVDFGGFLGLAENTVAVPWTQFTIDTQAAAEGEANFVLDVNEETLQNAPQIDIDAWPSWPESIDTAWENETMTFWETAG